jgi:hypothetical protein
MNIYNEITFPVWRFETQATWPAILLGIKELTIFLLITKTFNKMVQITFTR